MYVATTGHCAASAHSLTSNFILTAKVNRSRHSRGDSLSHLLSHLGLTH